MEELNVPLSLLDDTPLRTRQSIPMPPPVHPAVPPAESGGQAPAEALFTALYGELHLMARRELARRGGQLALNPTTLLHEAYLDISARTRAAFPDRHRFMGYAARVMRGLIVDYARRQRAQKRGGAFHITALDTDVAIAAGGGPELEALSAALEELAAIDPRLAQVVDLKFFCGFSFGEIAAMQSVSERTIQRDWEKARIFLYRVLRKDQLTQ
jgi:RNA polymerase sigma factor (TIGR02999 family)